MRNSWGEDWGMNGDAYITMDPDYNCGIGTDVTQITLA